jgi:hypothetical protein
MIDDRRRFIFVENPKTATFSLKRALVGNNVADLPEGVHISSFNHCTPQILRSRHPEKWREYTTFVVVRNTWDRGLSFFHFYSQIADSKSYQALGFDRWVALGCPPPDEDHLREPMWGEGRFDDVLCQLRYTEDVDEVIVLDAFDFDARREQLEEGFQRVCGRLGFEPPLIPVDGNNFGRAENVTEWQPHTVDRLAVHYDEEISRFGFQKPSLEA